jgi:hypothetical protein
MQESFEAPRPASLNADDHGEAASSLSAQMFKDPVDFLKTLQSGYGEIAHGHDAITQDDLRAEATLGSTPQIRAASAIAADHFKDLGGIVNQGLALGSNPTDKLTQQDLDFAIDMENHNTTRYTLSKVAMDTWGSLGAGVVGGGASAAAWTGLTGGELLVGSVAVGTLAAAGVAVAGLGGAAYLGYEAFEASKQMNQTANDDSAKFRSWITEPRQSA